MRIENVWRQHSIKTAEGQWHASHSVITQLRVREDTSSHSACVAWRVPPPPSCLTYPQMSESPPSWPSSSVLNTGWVKSTGVTHATIITFYNWYFKDCVVSRGPCMVTVLLGGLNLHRCFSSRIRHTHSITT